MVAYPLAPDEAGAGKDAMGTPTLTTLETIRGDIDAFVKENAAWNVVLRHDAAARLADRPTPDRIVHPAGEDARPDRGLRRVAASP